MSQINNNLIKMMKLILKSVNNKVFKLINYTQNQVILSKIILDKNKVQLIIQMMNLIINRKLPRILFSLNLVLILINKIISFRKYFKQNLLKILNNLNLINLIHQINN